MGSDIELTPVSIGDLVIFSVRLQCQANAYNTLGNQVRTWIDYDTGILGLWEKYIGDRDEVWNRSR